MDKTTDKIKKIGQEVIDMLVEKNIAYGDSATKPINIFSKGNAVDSLCARIDDKISRIGQKGIYDKTEDTVKDLCGYLILLLIALDDKENKDPIELPERWVQTTSDKVSYYGKDPETGKEYIVND
tara:strand:+ start:89 stop:463 length:375 start_codon:yes stop_codon:yes gene_type:complete